MQTDWAYQVAAERYRDALARDNGAEASIWANHVIVAWRREPWSAVMARPGRPFPRALTASERGDLTIALARLDEGTAA